MTAPKQLIHPHARRDALTFCLMGTGVFAVTVVLQLAALNLPVAAFALLYIVSAALALLGVAKLIEPRVSLSITPDTICYHHLRGQWCIAWDNIVRFDVPRTHRGVELESLPYIGFRLQDFEPVLRTISPRLTVHLINEQRHLLAAALRRESPANDDYSAYFDIPESYQASSGRVYHGLQALFAVRSQQLRELLGYDLYIPANALDRPADEFCLWLRELQAHRNAHLSP